MRRFMQRAVFSLAFILLPLLGALRASERTATDLLPGTTFAYAELRHANSLLSMLLDHPLSKRLQENKEYQQAIETPQYKQFKSVVALIEKKIGLGWRAALEKLADGGLYAGIDAKTQGGVVLVRSGDPELLKKTVDTLVELVRADAKRKGEPDPIETDSYRDTPAHRAKELRLAVAGPWLVLTNKEDLGKQVIDNYLDGPKVPLSENQQFSEAKSRTAGDPTAWSYIDLSVVRLAPQAKKLADGKADNPAAEILVGGILADLAKAPYVTGAMHTGRNDLKLAFTVPHNAEWIGEARQYYFGPEGQGSAPSLLKPHDSLLAISTYRSLPDFWNAAADLFDDNTNAELAKAESGLSTLFSGREFGQDILGSFEPQIQIVAVRQTFNDGDYPVPAIKIPSFAFVFRLKDPETMVGEFKRTFQSLIGFLNIAGAQNGQPQLDFDIEKQGDRLLVTTTYAYEQREKGTKDGRINYNFSPSIAFVGNHFVLSSTSGLAKELAKLVADDDVAAKTTPTENKATNSKVQLNAPVLRDVLDDNRRQLISQNMLEKGHTREEAEKEIGVLLTLLGWLDGASLELFKHPDALRLELGVSVKSGE